MAAWCILAFWAHATPEAASSCNGKALPYCEGRGALAATALGKQTPAAFATVQRCLLR